MGVLRGGDMGRMNFTLDWGQGSITILGAMIIVFFGGVKSADFDQGKREGFAEDSVRIYFVSLLLEMGCPKSVGGGKYVSFVVKRFT